MSQELMEVKAEIPVVRELQRTEGNNTVIDVSTTGLDIRGISTSPVLHGEELPNGDRVRITQHGESTVVALVDGSIPSFKEDAQPEMTYIEDATQFLANTPLMRIAQNASVVPELQLKEFGKDRVIERPFIWMRLTPDKINGYTIIEWVGQGDTSIWAIERKNNSEEVVPIYIGAGDSIQHGDAGILQLGSASALFIGTDGGIQSVAVPSIASQLTREPSGNLSESQLHLRQVSLDEHFNRLRSRKRTPQEQVWLLSDFIRGTEQLTHGVENTDLSATVRRFNRLVSSQRSRLTDDVTLIGIHTYGKRENIPFSRQVRPLIDELTQPTRYLSNTHSERVMREFGKENVVQLIEELVEKKQIGGDMFARACALVKLEELGPKAREYIENHGLVRLPLDIQVHPAFIREPEADICNDLGFVAFGDNLTKDFNSLDQMTTLLEHISIFESMDIHERFPRGAWASVRHTTGQHITIPGAFITGEQGRGILVPTYQSGGIYLHSSQTHQESRRSFFYMSAGIAGITRNAFLAYSNLLRNPSLRK